MSGVMRLTRPCVAVALWPGAAPVAGREEGSSGGSAGALLAGLAGPVETAPGIGAGAGGAAPTSAGGAGGCGMASCAWLSRDPLRLAKMEIRAHPAPRRLEGTMETKSGMERTWSRLILQARPEKLPLRMGHERGKAIPRCSSASRSKQVLPRRLSSATSPSNPHHSSRRFAFQYFERF